MVDLEKRTNLFVIIGKNIDKSIDIERWGYESGVKEHKFGKKGKKKLRET